MSDSHGHGPNVKLYLAIFGALLVLTVVTVLVSWLHLPPLAAIAVAMAIATIKASLVAAFFMHLKGERVLIYGLLGLTVVFLGFLFIIPITDSVAISGKVVHAPAAPASETAEPAR